MRIHFERSGGFAGMRMTTTVDTSTIPPDEAQELQKLVESAEFFSLPELIPTRGSQTDRFRYKVKVETGGRRHTVDTGEDAAPDTLRPLLRRLTDIARSTRRE
jgi:hypothetical protein